jgi:delta 1-pyrroline-5-carboxylate dehydrogenase
VLTSSGDAALGAMLTGDPRVDVVSFTGSTATGCRVMESASRTIKKTVLELVCILKTSYVLMPLNLPTETGRLWSP